MHKIATYSIKLTKICSHHHIFILKYISFKRKNLNLIIYILLYIIIFLKFL